MLKSYRYIVILICAAILGIAGFQIYWLGNNYQLEKAKLSASINDALVDAVERALVKQGRFMFEQFNPSETTIALTIKDTTNSLHFRGIENDSFKNIKTRSIIHIDGFTDDSLHTQEFITDRFNINTDSIFHVDYDAVFNKIIGVFESTPHSLAYLDSVFRVELNAKAIYSDFCLNRYLHEELVESTFDEQPPEGFKSRKVDEFHAGGAYLQAIFPKFSTLIFERMSLSIMASLLLLAFITFCFVYILKTLFKQKKMADVRRDFVSNMTHEFKTPLSIISAVNEALTNFDILEDKKKTGEYLGIAKTEIHRLSGMVEKVLDMAAYEKKDFKLEKSDVNLHDLIMTVKNQFTASNEDALQIRFTDSTSSPIAKVDDSHMTNVIFNLLDNAAKYSPDIKDIDILLDESPEDFTVQIKDKGIGIAKQQREKIFDKFYRISTGDRHDVKGFGLGLSYVRKIIDLHNGNIGVESVEGQGSTFTIRLPKQ